MSQKKEIKLQGLPISDGIVCATVCLLNNDRHTQSSCTRILPENVGQEKKRLVLAIEQVSLKFDNLQKQVSSKIGKGEAEIFSALKFMLTDPTVTKKLFTAIEKNLCSAESAVFLVFDKFIEQFKSIDDKYIKERVTDITDIKQHLINELANEKDNFKCKGVGTCEHGHNRIVVAEELTPTITCNIDVDATLGFISERGGKTSHAAILSRALGIPAVTGIPDIFKTINCGTEILLNGFTGEVVLWPSEETKSQIEAQNFQIPDGKIDNKSIPGFKIMANISSSKEAYKALEFNADGIGLYRTEMEFISASSYANGRTPEEKVDMSGGPEISIKGRHVLIVEGVVDSGRTVQTIIGQLRQKDPASIEIVTLLDKSKCRLVDIDIKYRGFDVGDDFVIGYGLDEAQKYRNLPFIGKVANE